jgi:hypothetical protein
MLSPWGRPVARCVLVLPGPVSLDGRAVEVPGTDLVEAGFDQRRHLLAVQGDVDGLPGAEQAGADREIDVEVGELRAEGARLANGTGSPARQPRDPGPRSGWCRGAFARVVSGLDRSAP